MGAIIDKKVVMMHSFEGGSSLDPICEDSRNPSITSIHRISCGQFLSSTVYIHF